VTKKRKVCVVITARPSYARVRTALTAIRDHKNLELQLVVAASALLDRYGTVTKVIEQEGFRIDRRVFMVLEGESLVTSAKTTGLGLSELATVFNDLEPDIVVSIADRYETIATSIAAAYMNIPLAHIQGGEVTGSIDEKVRHANTKLADIHLVSCTPAGERVIRMGENPAMVFVTGCPSIDLAKEALAKDTGDVADLIAKYTGVGAAADATKPYLVVMQHPVSTQYTSSRQDMRATLEAVHATGHQALWFWPNVDAGSDGTSSAIRTFREHNPDMNAHFYKNMAPMDFLSLLINSRGIIGNSSVAIRECSYLGVPAVNIGSRQARRDRGRNVIDVPHDRAAIENAIAKIWDMKDRLHDDVYGTGNAGEQIADVLARVPLTIEKTLHY
jgi:UDP-hydrolysing UDP-N-acetyl-D-glucosamine 2-epimerase